MSVTITFFDIIGPTNGTYSGSFNFNGRQYTYSKLSCDESTGAAVATFILNDKEKDTQYRIDATYNDIIGKISTNFIDINKTTPFSSANFFEDSSGNPIFESGILVGKLTQESNTSVSLNSGPSFSFRQSVTGSTATLSGSSSVTNDWITKGGPILGQAYVASLALSGNKVDYPTLVDAIALAVAGVYYK